MPWSADENRDFLLQHVQLEHGVLDIGAGAGIWADLLKGKVQYIDAVEIFEPYIERFGLEQKYRKIYLGDFKDLAIPLNTYRTVILGDVLEHFEMDDALQVWEKARTIAGPEGVVLLSTPIVDWPQGEEEGNIHESHLSFFDMNALRSLSGTFLSQEGEVIGSVIAYGKEAPKADDLTVVITTIPPRFDLMLRAADSASGQTLQPARIMVQTDTQRLGAPANRDAGLDRVETKYVAFLDDDDYFYPDHLETLYTAIKSEDADIVYSWFDVVGGTDPFPQNFGQPWDPENPVQTTVTTLCRTEAVRKAGGYTNRHNLELPGLGRLAQGNTAGEDYRMVYTANTQGAKIVHVPKRTWAYVHHDSNTSGRSDRW